MSVTDTKVIDMWGIPKWDHSKIILGIADPLGWGDDEEGEHLLTLQDKINTYVAFIESGEIKEAIPSAEGKTPIIRVTGLFPLSEEAEKFIDLASETLKGVGIELEFILKESGA